MWSLERRVFTVLSVVCAIAAGSWWLTTDRTCLSFSESVARVGLGTALLALLIVVGAWAGIKTTSVAYLRPPYHRRLEQDSTYIRGALSDVNILLMAAAIAFIVSSLLREVC